MAALVYMPAAMLLFYLQIVEPNAIIHMSFTILSYIIAFWFFIELMFFKGTIGPNQYGPDPLGVIKRPS